MRELKQETYCLGKNQIEIIHIINTLGVISFQMVTLSNQVKSKKIASMKALMTTLRKEAIAGVTC